MPNIKLWIWYVVPVLHAHKHLERCFFQTPIRLKMLFLELLLFSCFWRTFIYQKLKHQSFIWFCCCSFVKEKHKLISLYIFIVACPLWDVFKQTFSDMKVIVYFIFKFSWKRELLLYCQFWKFDERKFLAKRLLFVPLYLKRIHNFLNYNREKKKSKIIIRQYEKQNNLNHSVTIHSGFKCQKIIPMQREKQLKSTTGDCNYLCVFGHSG